MRLAPGIWLLLYSPASLTSIRANGAVPSRRLFNVCAEILSAMVESFSCWLSASPRGDGGNDARPPEPVRFAHRLHLVALRVLEAERVVDQLDHVAVGIV